MLLGAISLSYLFSLALLSPVSILCYVLRAPLAVFSAACVLGVVLAAIDLSLQKGWRPLGKLFLAALGVELTIVALDMALGARTGAFFAGDAKVHLARIRFLLDHGFSNDDPYVSVRYFFPIYHTSLHHALYAACCQITRQDIFGVWFVSIVWAKLVAASGLYYLAWTIFDRQWPAWIAAMACIGHRGPVNFLMYPNQLAPYWLLPLAIAFALHACRSDVSWRTAVKLAAVSLVLGQMHGLYVLFAIVVTAPQIAGAAIAALVQGRRALAIPRIACLAALALGLPFIVVSKLGNAASEEKLPVQKKEISDKDRYFVERDDGSYIRDPASALTLLGGGTWGSLVVGVGVLIGLGGRRRREVLIFLVGPGVVAVMLYTPPICTAILKAVHEAWVLERIEFIFSIALLVLAAPSIAFWIEPKIRFRPIRSLTSAAAVLFIIPFADHQDPWTWRQTLSLAQRSADARFEPLREFRELGSFVRTNVPPGSTILAAYDFGMDLAMFADCRIVASASASNGVADWGQRRRDLQILLGGDTPWDLRRELMRKYSARYFFPPRPPIEWARGHVKRSWKFEPQMRVLQGVELSKFVGPPSPPPLFLICDGDRLKRATSEICRRREVE